MSVLCMNKWTNIELSKLIKTELRRVHNCGSRFYNLKYERKYMYTAMHFLRLYSIVETSFFFPIFKLLQPYYRAGIRATLAANLMQINIAETVLIFAESILLR